MKYILLLVLSLGSVSQACVVGEPKCKPDLSAEELKGKSFKAGAEFNFKGEILLNHEEQLSEPNLKGFGKLYSSTETEDICAIIAGISTDLETPDSVKVGDARRKFVGQKTVGRFDRGQFTAIQFTSLDKNIGLGISCTQIQTQNALSPENLKKFFGDSIQIDSDSVEDGESADIAL